MADHDRGLGDTEARLLSRADNPLARAVGRAPVTVRTKLLVAFAGIAALLVVIAVLGLRVLGQSNGRIESLGTLQLRAAAYQSLQTQAQLLRQLLAIRTAQDPSLNVFLGGTVSGVQTGHSWTLVDESMTAALSQVGPATDESRLGFTPPPGDRASLDRIRRDYRRFSRALEQILVTDRADTRGAKSKPYLTEAIDADNDLSFVTDALAAKTRSQTNLVIAQNRSAYGSSRNLFVGVGIGSVLLALTLGLVLSWSLIGPIQRTGTRLAEIAAGDFSRHLVVTNRDELGELAVNLNRMNDELRRLYEELETVSRHKSEFVANMSHELRTPLNAIIGFSEVLVEKMFGELNDRQEEYLNDILSSGKHLLSLINDILDLSKVEAGQMELESGQFSVREALENGLTMLKERASRHGISLGLEIDPDLHLIEADERKVKQVVFNLLSNAVKFTPDGGRIEVTAHQLDSEIRIAVRDTGIGIAPEDQERIFEEFRQVGQGSAKAEGTGLGLALTRKLVELHGGRIWVESELGVGSTFTFALPLRRAEASGSLSAPSSAASS